MLSKIFERILREYPMCSENETFSGNFMGTLVRRDLVDVISTIGVLGVHHIIKGSVGQGKWATVPWVAIMDTRLTTTTQSGIYVVYLFAGDGSSIYLTLNQGCTDIIQKKGCNAAHNEMVHKANKVRMMISTPDGFTAANDITLGNDFYESGCIFYKQYISGCVPDDKVLIADLVALLDNYVQYCNMIQSENSIPIKKYNPEVIEKAMDDEYKSDFKACLSKYKFSIAEIETILDSLAIVDTYIIDIYGSKSIYEYLNSDELSHLRKRLVLDKQFRRINKEKAKYLLRTFNQYIAFLHISEKEKIKKADKQSLTLFQDVNVDDQTSIGAITENASGVEQSLEQISSEKQILTRVDFLKPQLCEWTYPVSCIINGVELSGRNWARLLVAITEMFISTNNPNIASLYKQSLAQRDTGYPFMMDSRIINLYCLQLSNSYWINVHYSVPRLVDIIGRLCVHCGVNLNDVIINYTPKSSGSHRINASIAPAPSINDKMVNEYVRQKGLNGTMVKDVIATFNVKAPSTTIKLLDNDADIIALPNGRYIHRSSIVDLKEASDTLLRILQNHFCQFDGYSNHRLLFDAARIDLSLFMNDNAIENEATIYALAKYLFTKENYCGNQFVFYGNTHIWESEPDYPMNVRGIMIHRARLNGGKITKVECEVFLDRIMLGQGNFNQAIQFGSDSTFYQYAPGEFLLSEILFIDKAWQEQIKRALDELFEEKSFVIPRDISDRWYEKLPKLPSGLPWTPLLLQEVLRYNSAIGFKPVLAPLEQSRDTIAAAFLPDESDMTFADVVSAHLGKTMDLPRRMSVEELRLILRDAGMIEGNELIYNMHKALNDYRFALSDGNKIVYIHKG
jgi:hypothetical protein